MRVFAIVGVCLVVACEPKPTTTTGIDGTTVDASTIAVATVDAAPSSAPFDVVVTNLAPGEIEVTSDSGARVATATRAERHDPSGAWVPMDLDLGGGLRLVESCSVAPTECTTLAPHVPIRAVPWSGMSCSSQCNPNCDKNVWRGPGEFRFVVTSCAGDPKAEVVGPTFALPSYDAMGPAFDRWKATNDLVSATAMRLDSPKSAWDPASAPKPDTVAGLNERKGTERPLDAASLTLLTNLLRDGKGFDDKIEKRCAIDHAVGFRLVRNMATTGKTSRTETVEVAIDFVCEKLFVVRGGDAGRARVVHATHFDPSRAAFLSLSKGIFATDKELTSLK
jgi:hypothetical protein